MKTKLDNAFGKIFEADLLGQIEKFGTLVRFKEDELLIDVGVKITTIPLVLNGIIKVLREDKNEHEIILYFLEKGSTCAVSLNCLKSKKSKLKGIVEKRAEVIAIPIGKAEEWLEKYESWRKFVIESNSTRLNEMVKVIDTLAFMNMDKRLIKYLIDKKTILNTISLHIKHQEIASDLNTSRVVISRLLKQLEIDNKIKLFRNRIEIIDLSY